MQKIFIGAIALAVATLPAASIAQTTSIQKNDNVALPKGNSGAGVSGMQGNKNGPAPKASSTTGEDVSNGGAGQAGAQDATKVPGKTGGKAGPAARSPSDLGSK